MQTLIACALTESVTVFLGDIFPRFISEIQIIADYAFSILTSLVLAELLQALSHNQLIRKCTRPATDWDQTWKEFEARFASSILLFISREMKKITPKLEVTEFNETIKDLRQDVYILLLKDKARALRNFQGQMEESIFGYLNIISKNVVRNYLKQQRRAKRFAARGRLSVHPDERKIEMVPEDHRTQHELEWNFLKDEIVSSLRKHWNGPNFERDILIFQLFFFDGLQAKEICDEHCELSQSGVETVLSRMRKRLKEALFEDS